MFHDYQGYGNEILKKSTGKPKMEAIQLRISASEDFKILNTFNPGHMENIFFNSKHTIEQAKILFMQIRNTIKF